MIPTSESSYLEAACTVNLLKLFEIMKEVRAYAVVNGLKPSFSNYRQAGAKDKTLCVDIGISKR